MKIALSLIAIFLSIVTSSAQSRTISKDEYEKVFEFAVSKTNEAYPVIFKVTTVFIENGKRVRRVTDLNENESPSHYRIKRTTVAKRRMTNKFQVSVGFGKVFCRDNSVSWEPSKYECWGPMSVCGRRETESVEYRVTVKSGKGKRVKVYREYSVFAPWEGSNKKEFRENQLAPTWSQNSPIELAKAKEAFSQARALSDADGARLWGVPLYGPMLFVDPKTRFVVANQSDRQGRLTENEGVFVGQLPENESIANTAYRWAGVTWTMLIWPLPANRYDRGRILMHENFHRIQEKLGLRGGNPANSHLDTEQGRTWLRLEWRALAVALIHRGGRRRSAILDALMFRLYRHSLFPRGAEQERALELNEGLAEYTGYKLSGWPEAILADRAAIRLEQDEAGTNFVRSFAYASGPAWAILLDEVPVRWRPRLKRESDLATILADALVIKVPANVETEVRRRAALYDGAAVMAREADRAEVHRQAVARHRARFLDGPVLILPLSESLRYTFSPQGAEALGDPGTVYLTSRVTDEWGILEVTNGVLLSRDMRGRVSEARVPAPRTLAGPTLEGDGWTLTLTQGWKLVPAARTGDFTVEKGK